MMDSRSKRGWFFRGYGWVLPILFTITPQVPANDVWHESSFEDFADGSFGDGGANTYVSRKGRIQLINRWDLNHDGFIDLVFSNTHPHREKLDAEIYWGNGKDFDVLRKSYIPNDGAQWSSAADLNSDGQMDLVLANYTNGTWDGMDSFVYFGGIKELQERQDDSQWGFHPFSRQLTLPTRAAQRSAIGDLNRDGHLDIIFALSAGFWEYRAGFRDGGYESPCPIYWGSEKGFDPKNSTDLPALGASDVAVEDLNGDSWPDVVFANQEAGGNADVNSFIYWGGPEGLDPGRRSELATHQAWAVELADADGDGHTDIVFANGKGPVSYVYLNRDGQFSEQHRLELPTHDARDCVVDDLNNDGTPDIFCSNHQIEGNPLTLSYLYWGSAEGFSAERRQEFETVGAWGVSTADLNQDGWKEIVVSNYKEHFSFDVPSYIFWNKPEGFLQTRRTSLFTQGAVGNLSADFNGDGHLDLLFNNTVGRTRGGNSPVYVYWGDGQGNYSAKRRLSLPAVDPYEWASADLNDDGWTELIVSNFGETVRWKQESNIYWGGPNSFSPTRRSALNGNGSAGATVADLDRDGYLDIVLSNAPKATDKEKGAFVFFGGADGYVVPERLELPTGPAGIPTVADLNQDGFLDLLFASGDEGVPIFWGAGTRNYSPSRRSFVAGSKGLGAVEVADLNQDGSLDLVLSRAIEAGSRLTTGFVYWGRGHGDYAEDRRDSFEIEGTILITVADVNQDGWLDLLCPNYNTGSSRATLSRVYLGGPDGFPSERMFTLPTNSGTGSLVTDFNQDGYNDILWVCHRSEGDPNQIGSFGDHVTDSFLYWGGADGFQPDRRLGIPARGPHNDSGVDLGNIYDRRHEYDYISSVHVYGDSVPRSITWKAQTPHGSRVRLQLRSAAGAEGLEKASWIGPGGPGTYYEQPGALRRPDASHQAMQYRAVLNPTATGAVSPILEEVVVVFD